MTGDPVARKVRAFVPNRGGMHARARLVRRTSAVGAVIACALLLTARPAEAHPLGNFTTNTATIVVVRPAATDVLYVVDMAEIPALQVRQQLGAVSRPVDPAVAKRWREQQCDQITSSLTLQVGGATRTLEPATSTMAFLPGQAGLSTLRLECTYRATALTATVSSGTTGPAPVDVTLTDANFADRVGWREIVVQGDRMTITGNVATTSTSNLLRAYPTGAVTSPLHERSATFRVTPGGPAAVASTPATPVATDGSGKVGARGNDSLTRRFQSLVAQRDVTIPFALGAIALAVLLGGLHALAPGHGKTIMAAYAVGRRGSTGDILSIGATVALTHTVGIIILGALVSATTAVSPTRTLEWASVLSGLIVIGVGVTIVRNRFRNRGRSLLAFDDGHNGHAGHAPAHSHAHAPHEHGPQTGHAHGGRDHDHGANAHDHEHGDNGHGHDHGHDGHEHPHHDRDNEPDHEPDHEEDRVLLGVGVASPRPADGAALPGATRPASSPSTTRSRPLAADNRYVVTSHAHGGWQHDHVLPAPGAIIRRRELVMMGLAGGMVPSPSALVVLLGAIALGRVGFGLGLVVAYGIGLAITLIAAGLLLVRFESRIRRWTTARDTPMGARFRVIVNALPFVSGIAIIGAGLLLVARSLAKL